jgi:DNA polymerase I-like protein with 3'-5' exonuclease and polymerase domains/uracil-DNA glycosylase
VSYDPVACGARCHECPLEGCRVVPPESHAASAIAVVGDTPGEQEEKIGKPLVGPSGNEFMKAARIAGLRRNDLHITSALLCRPPGGDLKKLLAKISKWNREEVKKAKEEGRTAKPMATPLACCKPRLDAEVSGYTDFITLGGTGTKAITTTQGSILALRGALMDLDRDGPETRAAYERANPLVDFANNTAAEAVKADYAQWRQANGYVIRVMPTIHPSFVLRQQRWAHVFRNDMAKAVRWFRGAAKWVPPKVTYNPDSRTLERFLSDTSRIYTYDIETDGIECLTAHIRCIAIGDADEVMVVGFRSNWRPKDQDGEFLDFYFGAEALAIGTVLRTFFVNPAIMKAGHNAGYYDRLVVQNQMGVDPQPVLDTMLLHRSVESELPHSLAYVASIYTEAPSWKTDRSGRKLALGGESDEELHLYCANDVAITARVLPPLVDQVALRDQAPVWRVDQEMQRICGDMHTVGMYVDQQKRLAEERKLLGVRHDLLEDIRDRLDLAKFNPGSVYQLRDVLFADWGLDSHIDATDLKEKDTMTGGGDRSTGDLILRTLLTIKSVPDDQREIIKLIRRYRKCLKVLGTYVVKLRPSNMGANLGWDDDDDWLDQETRKKYGEEKRGIVDPRTGRMHPGYNAHVAVTGRLSSSKPINAQNFPGGQRGMVVAAPGHVLVGADMDQLELRIAASLWDVELYLRAFKEGKDPHAMTAFSVFGEEFCKAAGLTSEQFHRPGRLVGPCFDANGVFLKAARPDATSMRNLSKAVQYACIEKNEHVAVLGPEGSKPISELSVGEWTWCWSRTNKRYEAAEITEVMPRGTKECVELTFSWWGGPRKGRCTESVVVTDDHLCLLRDGTFRAAGELLSGDRLMPFRRREGGTCGPYRRVMPFNDKREMAEHRVVKGFYTKDPTHVHHDDENTRNNNPVNLKIKTSQAHYAVHKEALDEGRKESGVWRASVADSGTRSAASKKMWARRRSEGTARFGSILDPFSERIGHEPDKVIAGEAGCTPQSVYSWRKSRGVPAYWKESPGGTNHKVVSVRPVGKREVWDIEVDHEDHNFPLAAGIFVHNSQYMGTVEIVHQLIQKTELPSVDPLTGKPRNDGTTDLPYAKLPLRRVREMRENWLQGAREFEYGWEKEINEYREQGYLCEPVGGRRRDFLDGEDPNQLVNFKVQGGAAGLMNRAIIQLAEAIPLHKWGPGTGINNQCHDSIVVECPADGAGMGADGNMVVPEGSIPWRVARLMEECMNQTDPTLPNVLFSASADVGLSWKAVG